MSGKKSVVEFEFHTGLTEEMHFHQNLEMVYLLSGSAGVKEDESTSILTEGNFVLFNANKKHAVRMEQDALMAVFVIDFMALSEIIGNSQLLFWCNTMIDKNEAYGSLKLVMDQILNCYFEQEKEGALYLNSLYYKLLYILAGNFMIKADDTRLGAMGNQDDTRIYEIQTYVQSNYKKQISLGDLARKLYLSNAYLSKYIKKHFGLSFLEYLNNIRLFHAVDDLLYTEKKIIRVALDNGFPSTASFNRAFKDSYNITPSEYRSKIHRDKKDHPSEGESGEELEKKVEEFLNGRGGLPEEKDKSIVESLTVNAGEMKEMNKPWSKVINFGDAYSLLRSDIQKHVLEMKKELGFRYIRISSIFVSSMYNGTKESGRCYNFHKLDRVIEFLLENDLKPFIELSFKPIRMTDMENREALDAESRIIFDSLEGYRVVMEEFASYLVNRFGIDEIEKWYFEFWKDPRLNIEDANGWYYEDFEVGFQALKKISPKIKVGGAGMVLGYESHLLPGVCQIWRRRKIRPDFWSVYSYQTVTVCQNGIFYQKKSLDGSFIADQLAMMQDTMKEEGFVIDEIFVTEWNFTFSNRNRLNDSCAQGAFIMKSCIELEDKADLMAYWSGTDLYSEDYESDGILTGDSGLLSRDGIKKPSFYAFRFLNSLLDKCLGKNEHAILSTNGRGNYVIVCHNSKKLNYKYAVREENTIQYEEQDNLFEETNALQLNFQMNEVLNGTYQVRIYYVNNNNGSVQSLWSDMGFAQGLSGGEIDYLKRSAMPHVEIQKITVEDETLRISTRLEAHEIRMMDISYQY